MKISKSILLAGILFMGLAGMSQAQTVVRFTGSTAYRSQTNQSLLDLLTSGTTNGIANSLTGYGYAGAVYKSASQTMLIGTIGGTNVILETSWSGSEAGIQAVAANGTGIATGTNAKYITLSNTSACTLGGTPGLSATDITQIPDVALSDTYQSTSQFNSNASINIVGGGTQTYAALTGAGGYADGVVGVVPFVWVASNGGTLPGATGTISNMTPQLMKGLWKSGVASLALATGNSGDAAYNLVATGRNPDSGTRLTMLAETGYGTTNQVKQYQPKNGSNVITTFGSAVNALSLWPKETINGVSTSANGNSGYSSGGQLAAALGSDTHSVGILVSMLGTSDAASATLSSVYAITITGTGSGYTSAPTVTLTGGGGSGATAVALVQSGTVSSIAVSNGGTGYTSAPTVTLTGGGGSGATATASVSGATGVNLSYAGVQYSIPAIQQGQYTCWGYEHMYYRAGSPVATLVDAAAQYEHDVDAQITIASMQATRAGDGGVIGHN